MVQSCDFHAPTASVMKEFALKYFSNEPKCLLSYNSGSFVLHGTKHAVSHSYKMFCFVLHVLTIGDCIQYFSCGDVLSQCVKSGGCP